MALDFPNAPSPGEVFDNWEWDGTKWIPAPGGGGGGGTPVNAAFVNSPNPSISLPNGFSGMVGLGITFTPQLGGSTLVILNWTVSLGMTAQVMYGTGIPPANGAAHTGTAITGSFNLSAASNSSMVSGLVAGTTYWFDFATTSPTAGNTIISNTKAFIMEV